MDKSAERAYHPRHQRARASRDLHLRTPSPFFHSQNAAAGRQRKGESTMGSYTKKDVMRLVAEEDVALHPATVYRHLRPAQERAITASQVEKALNNQIMIDGSSIEGFTRIHVSDQYLYPDPASFAILPWAAGGGGARRGSCATSTTPTARPSWATRAACSSARSKGRRSWAIPSTSARRCEFFLFETDEKGRPTTRTGDEAGYFDLGPVDPRRACPGATSASPWSRWASR